MIARLPFIFHLRRHLRHAATALPLCAGMSLLPMSVHASAPVAPNLSGGLEKLVESNVALKNAKAAGTKIKTFQSAQGKSYTSKQAAAFGSLTMTDDQGRLLVRVHFNGQLKFNAARKAIKTAAPSLAITAIDRKYKAGVLNAYVNLDEVSALAEAKGVGSVALETLPDIDRIDLNKIAAAANRAEPNVTVGATYPNVGTTFDNGVIQHRVDLINKYYNPGATLDLEGQGMQIGFISDSYAKSTTTPSATTDVANFDLPGSPSNPINTTPVAVLQDYSGTGTDEGRAMVQIGYRMAPKAALAFATANGGEVGFANNIRALAGIAGYTYSGQTFAADTICDDVTYADEPVYEDGIIAQGVEDASAAGVAYFSSAGNNIGTNTYESKFNYVPYTGGTTAADCPALVNTNINLAGVPAGLYAGGFHNFNPGGPQDVAQTWGSTSSVTSRTSMQWDDPYNQTVTFNTPAIYTATGTSDGTTTTPSTFTTPTLTAGANYVISVTATSGGFDAILTIKDPNGNTVINAQDTGTDETVNFFPTVSGAYTIIVGIFGNTTGTFAVNVYTGNNKRVSSDFNLLVFDTAGNYLSGSSLATDNLASNVPYEAGFTYSASGQTRVQYLVTRSAIPTISPAASVFRIDVRGNGASGLGPVEYFTVNQPNTKAHSTAPSCNSTAAMSVFRPSIPEYYTSPGPVVKYFDKLGNRLSKPEVRLKPTIMAADAANTSFFSSDSTSDIDTKGNFGGTSAAAPHAAAIGALVLQGHGGRRSVTPAQMTSILQRSTFPHDLDPNFATASTRVVTASGAGKLTITANADRGLNPGSGAFNANSIQVSYVGPGSIATLTFNPQGTAATGGNTTGGNNGLDASNVYFDNVYPGLVFEPAVVPFTIGNGSAALGGTTAAFSNLAGAPSNGTNQYWTMALTFPVNAFVGGNTFNFTVGHAPQHDSTVSNGTGAANGLTATASTQADLFGGSVLIPEGTGSGTGMTFSGTMTDGSAFSGTFKNRIGSGYSATEGFGFIDASVAVTQSVQ